jgi:hypothetical protein
MRHLQRLSTQVPTRRLDPDSGNNKKAPATAGANFLKNPKCFLLLHFSPAVYTLRLVISTPYKKTVMFTKANLYSASLFLIIAIAQMALS